MAKKSKAQLAARGTVADPTRKDADRLRTEAKQSVGKSANLVGVMPEDMANEGRRLAPYLLLLKARSCLRAPCCWERSPFRFLLFRWA